ncbi:MAG TPA: thioesterase [Pseudomonas xinjiangensis]|uniref:Thioesterase n=2 Tax=root TaxID=1 RepID=A0A7V1BMQ8_9GAMM|nr:thioesterase [Halopseudomonas xinjiangensis]HEC49068.1 thioesterase [Halopseudomonas xinjiangensis]
MSGIIRNLFTLFQAFWARGQIDPWAPVRCHFWITPFDCGTSVLKSDKYLQLAESAQLDFLVKTGLLFDLLRGKCSFVNASQIIKFVKPVGMFKRVCVETEIVYADEKCTYFSHSLFVKNKRHGEVLVKVKFKKGGITVSPAEIFGECRSQKPGHIEVWDQMLEQMQRS